MSTRRVLVLAYACEPNVGSEPGAGWAWVKAAAGTEHEITVLTAARFSRGLNEALAANMLDARVVRIQGRAIIDKVSEPAGKRQYLHYADWCLSAKSWIAQNEDNFDVIHHVTYACDWLPSPGLRRRVPTIWGPVGGATYPPLASRHFLSRRAVAKEFVRACVTVFCRLLLARRMARRSKLVLALNADTEKWLSKIGARNIKIRPNCALEAGYFPPVSRARCRTDLLLIGRIHEFKGLEIALRALVKLPDEFNLRIYGDGPDRHHFERRVNDLGLAERVTFMGRRPQSEIASALRNCGALLFPSLHDSSPWTVAEAVMVGVPIVHLAHGGSGAIAASSGISVRADRSAPEGVAFAVLKAVDMDVEPDSRWADDNLSGFLDTTYEEVTG